MLHALRSYTLSIPEWCSRLPLQAVWNFEALLAYFRAAFQECVDLSFLDLPDSFWSARGRWLHRVAVVVHLDLWSAWGRWLPRVAVVVHLDVKMPSPSPEALMHTAGEFLPLSLLHALLNWVKTRTLYSENVAKGGNLSFMGKKTDPFGISEWGSPCNNPIHFFQPESWGSELLLLSSCVLKSGRNSPTALKTLGWVPFRLSLDSMTFLFSVFWDSFCKDG